MLSGADHLLFAEDDVEDEEQLDEMDEEEDSELETIVVVAFAKPFPSASSGAIVLLLPPPKSVRFP